MIKKGTKVRFICKKPEHWGVSADNAKHLVLDQVYTVDKKEIHTWHTKIFLKEVPDVPFNSVWFEEVKNKE